MLSSRNRVVLLLGAFLVQFQAAAAGVLPALPGVPTSTAEWATFCAYFVLTILAHLPKLKLWFSEVKPTPTPGPENLPPDGET